MSGIVEQIHPEVEIIFSTVADGSMASGGGQKSLPEHGQNADKFLSTHGFPLERSRVFVSYSDTNSYTEVVRVNDKSTRQDIDCDALYTTTADLVITLPVADCIATVVYDPIAKLLGGLHLGRHSSIAGLIESFAIEVADNAGSDPRDWLVWMSPSIRETHDIMDYFTPPNINNWREHMRHNDEGKIHIDNVGHNIARLVRAGVDPSNITVSPINTYTDKRFYSQRAYVEQGDPARLGRMTVAARILPSL